ncbi:MAG: hypothetical protein P4N59_11490 [Negativicutes bacterium]|nr:hypothetical protein [Negativicutes bacterium]
MPNIKQFDNREQVERPGYAAQIMNEAAYRIGRYGVEAGQAIGEGVARIGQAIRTAGEAYDNYQTVKEVSQGSAAIAGETASLTQQWNNIATHTDPNLLGQAAQNFNENTLEPTLAKLQGGFSTEKGQAWAAEHIQNVRDHFSTVQVSDLTTAGGAAAIQNFKTTADGTAAMVHSDPSSLDLGLKQVGSSVGGIIQATPNLDMKTATQLRTTLLSDANAGLVMSAVKGLVDKNPQAGLKLLNSPKYSQYLNAAQIGQLNDYARNITRANEIDGRLAQTNALLQANLTSQNAASSYIRSWANPTTGQLTIPPGTTAKIMSDPNLKPAEVNSLITLSHVVADPANTFATSSDPSTLSTLITSATLPPGAPGALSVPQLASALTAHKISLSDYNLVTGIQDKVANDPNLKAGYDQLKTYLTGVKGFIDTSTSGSPNPQAVQRYGEFVSDTTAAFQKGLAAGLTPSQMLDQNSPQYLGKNLPNYVAPASPLQNALQGKDPNAAPALPLPPVNQPITLPDLNTFYKQQSGSK